MAGTLNYIESVKYIDEVMQKKGSVLGLSSVKALLDMMDSPQNRVPIIHVAGTNGKGSVVAFISSILMEAGYKTGIYMSPAVFERRECIRINNRFISEEEYAEEISSIREYTAIMEKDNKSLPTAFEMETAAAFHYFYKSGCDIAVMETGVGGTDDATNVCDNPLVSVIMSVSMDHMGLLGNTLKDIALCKAGIIKPGGTVVLYRQTRDVIQTVKEVAAHKNARLRVTGQVSDVKYEEGLTEFTYKSRENLYKSLKIQMLGTFQPENAAAAIEVCEAVKQKGYIITQEAVYAGLYRAVHHGRFEKIGDNPLFFIDGAHNPGASARLRESVDTYFSGYHLILIMGVLADKDFTGVINDIKGCGEYILAVTPKNKRSLPAAKLAEALQDAAEHVEVMDSIEDAVKRALFLSGKFAGTRNAVIAFGSLSYLGDLKNAYDMQVMERHGGD